MLTSIPRSCNRSSTFLSDKGNRTYIITARRMISREVLKYRNGLGLVIPRCYPGARTCSSLFALTEPEEVFIDAAEQITRLARMPLRVELTFSMAIMATSISLPMVVCLAVA
jgi:hypothetical protein